MAQATGQQNTSDTCARCGLKRLTRSLEDQGIAIRLCDDCYWGKEPAGRQLPENTISAR